MGKVESEKIYKPINLLDFGFNENEEYVNLREEAEQADKEKFKTYSYEEIIKGYEDNSDFCVIATFYTSWFIQYRHSLIEIQKEILKEAVSKCYYFGNLEKDIYVYSYKIKFDDGEEMYRFTIENDKHIVIVNIRSNENDILTGKETICYPACEVYLFEITEHGIKQILSGYGNKEKDIRYKILCNEFKILEFSSNRIDPDKKPTDFYEAEYKLPDFINYWKDKTTVL